MNNEGNFFLVISETSMSTFFALIFLGIHQQVFVFYTNECLFWKYSLAPLKHIRIPKSNLYIFIVTFFLLPKAHPRLLLFNQYQRQFYLAQRQRSRCLLNYSLLMIFRPSHPQCITNILNTFFRHLIIFSFFVFNQLINCGFFTMYI